MGKTKDLKRRLIQLYSALLYNAHLRGFAEGEIFTGSTKSVCVPGFNCYSCPGATGACPLGSLQNALGSLNKNIGFYVFGILLLYGMLFGRTVCGWFCPLGLIQELLHKIPTPKLKKSRFTRILSYLKYVILAVFVVIIPIWYGILQGIPVPGFCKYICPAGTFEGAIGLLPNNPTWLSMLGPIFTQKFVIMVIIGLACIFCYRAFCRFLCPLGAIYGMFNKISVIGVKVDKGCCNNCGACVRNCKMDVAQVGDHECIHCAHCVAVCNQKAISFKLGKITLPMKKSREIICWITALLVLLFMIIWSNFLDPSVRDDASDNEDYTVSEESEETVYPDIDGFQLVIDEDDNVFYISDDNDVIYMDDSGDLYYVDDDGNYTFIGSRQDLNDGSDEDEYSDSDDGAYDDDYSDEDGSYEGSDEYYESDAPIGYDVGERLADFDAQCLDGSSFSLADTKGKVVIINLWATYCGPCVKELPHFADLYHEHEGDLEIIAVHSSMTSEDVGQFLEGKGWDIKFTVDDQNNTIFNTVNGSLALPQTIVLNRNGEVTYNQVGSVSAEMLKQLYDEASQ